MSDLRKKKTNFHEYDSEESNSSRSSNYSDQIRKFNDKFRKSASLGVKERNQNS